MTRKARNRPSHRRLALGALLVPLLLAAGAEWAARRRFPEPPRRADPMADYAGFLRRARQPAYRLAGSGGEAFFEPLDDKRGAPVPRKKTAGRTRIAVLGESSAYNLARALANLAGTGGGALDVLNLAEAGCSLDQMEARARSVFEYEPDAVVVLFGNNLFFRHPSAFARRAGEVLRRSRLLALLQIRWNKRRIDPHDPLKAWGRLDAFLEGLAAKARKRRVFPVFCTVALDLHYPPGQYFEAANEVLLEALYLRAAGDEAASIRQMRSALLTGRDAAWAQYLLGDWLLHRGEATAARVHLTLARDGAWDRASVAVNHLIRKAARRGGAVCLDLETLAAEAAPLGVPGWEAFDDAHHANAATLAKQAAALLSLLDTRGLLPAGARFSQGPVRSGVHRRLEKALSLALTADAKESVAACAIEARFDEFAGLLRGRAVSGWDAPLRALAFRGLAEALWRQGKRADAFQANRRALGEQPEAAETFFQRGVFHLGNRRPDLARRDFRTVLERDPDHRRASYFLKRLDAGGPT